MSSPGDNKKKSSSPQEKGEKSKKSLPVPVQILDGAYGGDGLPYDVKEYVDAQPPSPPCRDEEEAKDVESSPPVPAPPPPPPSPMTPPAAGAARTPPSPVAGPSSGRRVSYTDFSYIVYVRFPKGQRPQAYKAVPTRNMSRFIKNMKAKSGPGTPKSTGNNRIMPRRILVDLPPKRRHSDSEFPMTSAEKKAKTSGDSFKNRRESVEDRPGPRLVTRIDFEEEDKEEGGGQG